MRIEEFIEALPSNSYNDKILMIRHLAKTTEFSVEDKKKLYKKLEENSYFVSVCFAHICQKGIPAFHKEIYSILDEDITYFGCIVFRGAAKSTIKAFLSIKQAVQQSSPLTMFLSESEDQAIDDLESVGSELEENEIIHWLYFNGKSPAGKTWAAKKKVLTNGCTIIAKGMDSRLRGKKTKMQRPTLIIFDDFESKSNSGTKEGRANVADTVSSVVIPMGANDCRYWFFNTLPNSECYMATEALNLDGIFHGPKGRLYKKELTHFVNGVETPTWLEEKPWEWINEKKNYFIRRKEFGKYLQEYYNVPEDEADPVFEIDKIEEFRATLKVFGKITYIETFDGKKILVNTFNGFDPACKTKARNDDTSKGTIAIDHDENIYIVDIMAEKITADLHPQTIMSEHEKYGCKSSTVETYGYQFSIMDWLNKLMLTLRKFVTIKEFSDKKSKSQKYIEGLIPVINTGKLKFLRGCRNIDTFLEQAKTFTALERKHDDTLDAIFLAILNAFKPPKQDVEMLLALEYQRMNKTSKKGVYNANYMLD